MDLPKGMGIVSQSFLKFILTLKQMFEELKSTIHILVVWLWWSTFARQTVRPMTKCVKCKDPNLFSGAIFAGNSNLQNEPEHRYRHVAFRCFASDRFTKSPLYLQSWTYSALVRQKSSWCTLLKEFLSNRTSIPKQGSDHVWSCEICECLQSDDVWWCLIFHQKNRTTNIQKT